MRQQPQDYAEEHDDSQGQTVTDVHGTQKISGLAIEVQAARETAVIHLGETPVNAGAEDPARPAPRAELAEDAAESGWPRTEQEPIIAETRRGSHTGSRAT